MTPLQIQIALHILAYLAGIVTAVLLVWGWVGAELSSMGSDQDGGEDA